MEAYHQRLAQTAIRFTGKPVVLSPQVRDYLGEFPETIQPMKGDKVDFRVVLFMGVIDMTDVTITVLDESECDEKGCLKIHVMHGFKDIYELSDNKHYHVPCARECATYCRLPKGVSKGSLSAQWTQDGFLVIQSLKTNIPRIDFQCKRIVPVKVHCNLDPSLDLCSVISHAANVFQNVSDLWKKLNTIVPLKEYGAMTSEELYGILSGARVQPRDACTDAGWKMQFEIGEEATVSAVDGKEIQLESKFSIAKGKEDGQDAAGSVVDGEKINQVVTGTAVCVDLDKNGSAVGVEADGSPVSVEVVDPEADGSPVSVDVVDPEADGSSVSVDVVDPEANGSSVSVDVVDPEANGSSVSVEVVDPEANGSAVSVDVVDPEANGSSVSVEKVDLEANGSAVSVELETNGSSPGAEGENQAATGSTLGAEDVNKVTKIEKESSSSVQVLQEGEE